MQNNTSQIEWLFNERSSRLGFRNGDNTIEFEEREKLPEQLREYLTQESFRYFLWAAAGTGKSTALIKCLVALDKPFVFLAPTKKIADQLGEVNGLPVVHADSNDSIGWQTITIYDHIAKFVDWDNLDKCKETYLIIDEAHNIITARDPRYRGHVIRLMEEYQAYFRKVVLLSATPGDLRAYGPETDVLYVEGNWDEIEVYATPYDDELKTMAHLVKEKRNVGTNVMVYLQSTGNPLSEFISYLVDLGINNIQVFNSNQSTWYYENQMEDVDPTDGFIKGDVLITTYAEGVSYYNKNFDAICCSKVNVMTAYQFFNRMRNGTGSIHYMFNTVTNSKDFDEIYEPAYQAILAEAKEIRERLLKIPSITTRALTYKDDKPLVKINGELYLGEVSNRAHEIAHKEVCKDWRALETGFAQYHVKLLTHPKIYMLHELEFTKESREKIISSIFQMNPIPKALPSHYQKEVDKIKALEKYLSWEEIKDFMLGEYIERPTAFDILLQQLKVKENPFDSQLKVNLSEVLEEEKTYTVEELDSLVNPILKRLDYQNPYKSIRSLLQGLGFELKRTSRREEGIPLTVYKILYAR